MSTKFDMTGTYEANGEVKQFNYRTSLTVVEKMKFVEEAVKLVITDTYEYVIRDLMFDYLVIRAFTDVNCSDIDECDNSRLVMEMVEDLVCNTSVVDTVKAHAGDAIFTQLNRAIDYDIQCKTGLQINPVQEALAGILRTIDSKLASYDTESMSNVMRMLNGINANDFNVDALLNAYANSDVFKIQQQNLLDAAAERQQMLNKE